MSLCPEADFRASLDEGDFWHYVLLGVRPGEGPPAVEPWDDSIPPEILLPEAARCPECGAFGACGYDDLGRALIHATDRADADPEPWATAS